MILTAAQTQARQLAEARDAIDVSPDAMTIHPSLRQAEGEALESQLTDLRDQLRDYESLQSGEVTSVELESLDELPTGLIKREWPLV